MTVSKLISTICIALVTLAVNAQDKEYDSLSEQVDRFGQVEIAFAYPGYDRLTEIGQLISVAKVDKGMVYCVLTRKDLDNFLGLNLSYKIIPREVVKAVESALTAQEAMNWDLYPTYRQYDTIVHKLAADYPAICRVDTIGESVGGRLILALKISDNVAVDEDEPEVFYTSNIHGDELQGFVLMLRLAEHLLVNSSNEGLEQSLVDSLEIWINPLSNPDGTYHGGDTISYPTRANANGTDLNRNFPDPLNPSIIPDTENAAMIDFMRSRNFILSANFHAGFEVLNFPWDRWLSRIHADSLWFYHICRRYADTVHNYSVPSYMNSFNDGVVRGALWYTIQGGRQDFVTYELQGREVTIELDDTKETPAAQLPLLWNYNHRSFLGYLENAFYGIHGTVVDSETDEPVEARIFIPGHDKDSSHVYTNPVTGSFIRMVSPGTWNLIVSAEGYEPTEVSDITVGDRQQIRVRVRLLKTTSVDDSLEDNRIRIWPVPASGNIYLESGRFLGSRVNIRVYSQTGIEVSALTDLHVDSERLSLDISYLPPGYYILTLFDSAGHKYSGRFIHY